MLSRRKSDPVKLVVAARLRRETTLSIKAIAQRLYLGTSKSANIRLQPCWVWKRSSLNPYNALKSSQEVPFPVLGQFGRTCEIDAPPVSP